MYLIVAVILEGWMVPNAARNRLPLTYLPQEEIFVLDNHSLTFASWLAFSIPCCVILCLLGWMLLQIRYLGLRPRKDEFASDSHSIVSEKYTELGGITFHEIEVLVVFGFLVTFWILDNPSLLGTWSSLYAQRYVTSSVPSVAAIVVLFYLPKEFPTGWKDMVGTEPREAALTWKLVHEKMIWHILLIIGSGLSIADAAKASGLSIWISDHLKTMVVPSFFLLLFVIAFTAMLTEILSNMATISLLLPILGEMSLGIGVHPIMLMLSATIASSYAFMLPIATTANTMVYSTGKVKISEMITNGILMNLISIFVLSIMMFTWGVFVFDLDTLPAYVDKSFQQLSNASNHSNMTNM